MTVSPSRVLRRLDHELRSLVSDRRERSYDRGLGIETFGRHGHAAVAMARPEFEHAGIYQGAPAERFRALMTSLPISPAHATFIDLGCGKGKALFLAADMRFRRVIGVEFAPDLAATAEKNARAYAAARPEAPRVEIVCTDAGDYELPPEPTVLFLYNPFDEHVMARVCATIDRSLAQQPRSLFVVYLNPLQARALDAARHIRRMAVHARLLDPGPAKLFRGLRRHEHGGDLQAVIYEARTGASDHPDRPTPPE
jgi:SAM-dependent methyltransferase